jgi:hypothetical protein
VTGIFRRTSNASAVSNSSDNVFVFAIYSPCDKLWSAGEGPAFLGPTRNPDKYRASLLEFGLSGLSLPAESIISGRRVNRSSISLPNG